VTGDSAPFQSWDARFSWVSTLALVADKFLLNIDLCLPGVVRKVYMRPKPHATSLAYSQKQHIVGGFHYSHSACRNDTPVSSKMSHLYSCKEDLSLRYSKAASGFFRKR